jgi:hypothetical protein
VHYGWIVIITGVAVLFSCLGLGRVCLGILFASKGTTLEIIY